VSAATASAPSRYRVENIPAELVALSRWCVFQITQGPDGKTKKLPLIAGITGKAHAKNTDSRTWRPFNVALADAEARGLYLAFVFDCDLPYFFLDADDVIQADGTVRADVALVRDQLDTYTEWSVSGDGLHIIGHGAFPVRSAAREVPPGCKPIERYPLHGPRFGIFTGETLPGLDTIEERGDVLAALFPPRATSHANGSTDSAGYRGAAGELTAEEAEAIIEWAAPFWKDGRRHHMALYLSGELARQGVSRAQAAAIIERCAENDSDPGAKLTACHDTYDDLAAGADVSGWYGLKDVCGLTEHDLAPLSAILEGFWKRHNAGNPPNTDERDRAWEAASAAQAVPCFPLHVLPREIRAFVSAAAASIGCPVDFVAIPTLALAEGVMGKSRRIVIREGFEVSPGSWYGVIADPGTGKSPGQKYAMRLVAPLQDEAWQYYRDRLEQWEATPKEERDEKPAPEHFFVTDSTGEALWQALATSSGVTQIEDELRRRLKSLDAYRQAGDRQAMLGLWSNAPVKIVRRTSMPVYIPFPVAPLCGGIQPGVLRHLRGEGGDAEADDGWVPRFLLTWPDAEPLALSDVAFDSRTVAPAVAIFRGLRLIRSHPHDTMLSAAAYARFRAWHAENRRAQMGLCGLERQWAAKAPFHLARLALVLHLLAWPHEERRELSERTIQDAITLLEYFRDHLARVLPAFGTSATSGTKTRIIRILRTSKTKDEGGWVSRSDISNGLRNVTPDDLTAALEALLAAGTVERQVRPTPTKPSEWWRLTSEQTRNTAGEDSDYSDYSQHETTADSESDQEQRENPNNPNSQHEVETETTRVADVPPDDCGKPNLCSKLGSPCPSWVRDGACPLGRAGRTEAASRLSSAVEDGT
jgi:hypothetical protein